MQDSIRSVAIIGAGAAGRQFAFRCAAAGFQITLEDVMPAKLRRAEEDFATLGSPPGALRFALTVEDAVRDADIAIDFVPDELESKLEIFCMIDRMAPPRTIILTPTEVLSITDLASCTYRGDRCFAIHGGLDGQNRPRLITCSRARPETIAAVEVFLAAVGLSPVAEPEVDVPAVASGYS
jgi:3-hydroxybutyryl-CoA dehydrogenase